MAKYKIEFAEKYLPYQKEDEWHIVQCGKLRSMPFGIVRYIGKTKKECEEKLKELKGEK